MSVKCLVFYKVLSNQYQMDSASIFVLAAQNMPHMKVFKITLAELASAASVEGGMQMGNSAIGCVCVLDNDNLSPSCRVHTHFS